MNKIYQIINERSGGKYNNIRFGQVIFSAGAATVKVLCDEADHAAVKADSAALQALISDVCGFNCAVYLIIEKADRSAKHLRESVLAFTDKFPHVTLSPGDVSVTPDGAVTLRMHKSMLELARADYLPRLDEFLSDNFLDKIDVRVVETEFVAEREPEQEKPQKKIYALTEVNNVFGEVYAGEALSAASVEGNNDNISVCGVLTMVTSYKSKGSGAKRSCHYEKFLLYDGERTLQCKVFPHGNEDSLLASGLINVPVCVFGNTVMERGRTGECTMMARSIASCKAQGLNVYPAPAAPGEYKSVFPKPYEEYVQASLFQASEALPDFLRGTFVAFDFETTGLSILFDVPTELGAVKIVDGVITETFHTMIDPCRPIPDIVVKKTGITDDMVKGQPLFKDVLPDFYKFSYGAALVGHNIAFDFPFLIKYGNGCGMTFGDRRTYDTMGMAPQAMPGIDVLTLDNVLSLLGLVNDNAHRALSDATATAKAFIAMSKMLYK